MAGQANIVPMECPTKCFAYRGMGLGRCIFYNSFNTLKIHKTLTLALVIKITKNHEKPIPLWTDPVHYDHCCPKKKTSCGYHGDHPACGDHQWQPHRLYGRHRDRSEEHTSELQSREN